MHGVICSWHVLVSVKMFSLFEEEERLDPRPGEISQRDIRMLYTVVRAVKSFADLTNFSVKGLWWTCLSLPLKSFFKANLIHVVND